MEARKTDEKPRIEFSDATGLGVTVYLDGILHGIIKDLRGMAGGWLVRIPELPVHEEGNAVLAKRMRGEAAEKSRVHFRTLKAAKKAVIDAIGAQQ